MARCNYKVPELERCCGKCAFCAQGGNDSWEERQCNYMLAHFSIHPIDADVSRFGCCDHFFSKENAKLLCDCSSPEELDMKLTIFGIQLDPLLVVELKDGFKQHEKATSKMSEHMERVKDILERNEIDDLDSEVPLAIDLRHVSKKTGIIVEIKVSSNFSRVNAFLKKNVPRYKKILEEHGVREHFYYDFKNKDAKQIELYKKFLDCFASLPSFSME